MDDERASAGRLIAPACSRIRGRAAAASAFVDPEWIVINPTDYEAIRLLTDTAGQFFGGGPFKGPYGRGSPTRHPRR
jgi:hypothetical protein